MTAIKNWWRENRWLLTKRTLFAFDCVIILIVPFMQSPYSHVAAAFVVLSLLLFLKDLDFGYPRQVAGPRKQPESDLTDKS